MTDNQQTEIPATEDGPVGFGFLQDNVIEKWPVDKLVKLKARIEAEIVQRCMARRPLRKGVHQ